MPQTLRQDLLASIVVFLVALPLSMGVAIASGVPLEHASSLGLLTAVVGGLVVGACSGCQLQVSGPAAGLAVMVGLFIQKYGFHALGPIVLVAGIVQIVAGGLKMGQIFRAVAPALIEGMLAGIGLLILASQMHVMVDDSPPGTGKEFGGIINLATAPLALWKGLTVSVHQHPALLGLLTITVMILWNKFAPKKLSLVPAPLIGVTVATLVSELFDTTQRNLPLPESLFAAVHPPGLSDLALVTQWSILAAGISMALVASAESLLTATAVDAMQTHSPRTRYDRELMAQGLGNTLCGCLGLLPITGVIVRSSANVLAGGRTRLSTMLHGIWILLFGVLFPGVLRLIPVSSLAAILVYTGYKLMNPKTVAKLWKVGRFEVLVYSATMSCVVCLDLLTGIAVGIFLCVARIVYIFTYLDIKKTERGGKVLVEVTGAATFIRLPALAAVLEDLPADCEVHVDMSRLTFIDHACFELMVNWERQRLASGGDLVLDWEGLDSIFGRHTPERGSGSLELPAPAALQAAVAGEPALEPPEPAIASA